MVPDVRIELHPKLPAVLMFLTPAIVRAADLSIRMIDGRQWLSQREGRPYLFPINTVSIEHIRYIADQFDIAIPEAVEAAFALAPVGESPYRFDVQDDALLCFFPFDEELVRLIQALPARSFQGVPKKCWKIANDVRNYLPIVSLIENRPAFVLSDAAKHWLNALYKRYRDQPVGLDVSISTTDRTVMQLDCAIDSAIESSLKVLPLAKGKDGRYSVPILRNTVESVERLCKRANTPIDPSVRAAIQVVLDEQEVLFELSKAEALEMEFPNLNFPPFDFQKAGIAYALQAKGCIIGDEMGLGKTIQGIGVIDAVTKSLTEGIALIFCPPQLAYNWAHELTKWIKGNPKIVILRGYKHHAADVAGAHVVIVPYSVAYQRWKNKLADDLIWRNVKAVIMDEFHYLKSHETVDERSVVTGKRVKVYKTQRVRGVFEIVKALNIPYRVGLTGTALTKSPIELAAQLDIIGKLELFGGFTDFRSKYCGAHKTRFGWKYGEVPKAVCEELHDRMRRTCYVRRTVGQVMKELPPLLMSRVLFELSPADQATYRKAEDDTVTWIADQAAKNEAFEASLLGLTDKERELAIKRRKQDASRKAERALALARITALRQLAANLKRDQVIKQVNDYLDSGEKVLLFCHHKEQQEAYIAAFPEAARLIARDSQEYREKEKTRFEHDENCRLMILSDVVGAEGHTLVAARIVVFAEMPWTPKDIDQCMKRAHRYGQKMLVNVYFLLADKTIDMDLYELIAQKRRQVNLVLDGVDHSPAVAELVGEAADTQQSTEAALLERLKIKKKQQPVHA